MRLRTLVAAAFAVALSAAAHAEPGAKVLLRGGAIYTLDPAQPWAGALLIDDGRIAYVGDEAGASAYAQEGTRVIELAGRMVLPGFHDAHVHPMAGGMRLLRCKLEGKSVPEVLASVRACASSTPQDAWVLGAGWSKRAFGNRNPTRAELDRLVPDRPAYLTTEDGFTAWVNSKARVAAGLAPEGPGVLEDEAASRVRRAVPAPTQAQYREALRRTSALLNRFGVTSAFDASLEARPIEAYRAADAAGEMTLRVVGAQRADPRQGEEQVDAMIARRDIVRGTRFRADAAKLFLDGEIDRHTAALLTPYADKPASQGELFVPRAALDRLVRRLDAAGFLVHMHAMGDGAVRAGLDALEAAAKSNGPRDRRHAIAHLGVVDPQDFRRFAALGVAANVSPLWAHAGDEAMAGTQAALGAARSRWIFPLGSLAAAGARITAGSDWPSATLNPLDGIQFAMTRQPLDGARAAVQPGERIGLAKILAAYTIDAAWSAGTDKITGSLEKGKAADLVILERNLFEVEPREIHRVRVLATILDGKPVYRDPAFAWE